MTERRTALVERLKQRLKGPVRRMLRRWGYALVAADQDESAALMGFIRSAGVNLLIDVGANQGQYAERMRAAGYAGDIVSFEPGAAAFGYLDRQVAKDPRWQALKVALGEEKASLTLHVSANSVSSSLLEITDRHIGAARQSATAFQEEVKVERLDHLITADGRPTMLKIDTQGYELAVLRGATELFDQIRLVQVELSLVELYRGQPSYLDVLRELDALGFTPCLVLPGFADRATGEVLQVDVVARAGPRRDG